MKAHILDGIRRGHFVAFGRAGMDMFAAPIGVRSEDADTFRADLGGSSANTCVGLVKLGCSAALVTSVSNDAVGRFVLNRLQHYGVDASHVGAVNGEYRTSLAVYESRVENFQNVIYRNGAADFQVSADDVLRVDYARFGALLTSGTAFAAEPSRGSTFVALSHARNAGLPVIFDIDYRPYSWPSPEVAADVLTRAGKESDVIVGNDEEFDFMAGGTGRGLAKARALADENGRVVVYKMGENGATTFCEGQEFRTGIYPVSAVKPNGAGDSFMAGLLASLAAGRDLKDAVLRGSAAAAMTVSRPGCSGAMPTSDELEAFLAAHPGPTAG